MRHCCSFEPVDVWFLFDNEEFSERRLSFGFCPICKKPVAELIQFDSYKHEFTSIKKVGISSQIFVQSFIKQKNYSRSELNNMKFKQVQYGWVYGVNKEIHKKNPDNTKIRQYSSDFYGNKSLVKEI